MVTRGIKHCVDRFVNDMSAQYFPINYRGDPNGWVQLAMRPVQLWEVVFPKPSLQTVLRTIWENDEQATTRSELKWPFKAFKKVMKLKSIPPIDTKVPKRIVFKDTMATYPIGLRDDNYQDDGTTEDL